MNTVRLALMGLIGLYIFGISIAFISERSSSTMTIRELTSIEEEYQQTSYKFDDPDLAYKVLLQLEPSVDPNINQGFQSKAKDIKPYLNLKTDDGYCEKRRAYFAQYPESVFEEMDFLTDMAPKSLVRNKVLMQLGHDIQPYIGSHMSKGDQGLYDIKPTVANFFTRTVMFLDKKIGQHFSCFSQISNHIPGKQALAIKDSFAEAAMKYAERYAQRPQCFDLDAFVPETFLLYQKENCQAFFKIFNSEEYQTLKDKQKIVYMKKIGRGAHTGTGVDPLNGQEEVELRKVYNNGKNCGKVDTKVLIQKYIPNPLLLDGHKFDFNMFMLVASINPLMAFYHDGFLRVSTTDYDVTSSDKKAFLSNLSEKSNNAREGEAMNEDELKHAQQWTLDRFLSHLLRREIVKDPNWLDSYLRPAFKKAMIHLLRLGLVSFSENSSVYQLYGVDFMIDTDLNLWFLEANSAPGLDGFSQPVEKMIVKMLNDEVEIVMGLLRSRMKRVINYINEVISDGSNGENKDEVVIKNLETTKIRFGKINENYFEREFEPSLQNGFTKIVDENYLGTQKYMGFVSQECL